MGEPLVPMGDFLCEPLINEVMRLDQQPMVGLVTVHPHHLPDDHNPAAPCKHFIESPAFRRQFGCVAEVDVFEALKGYCSRARGGPLGTAEIVLSDVNGDHHVFWFETFFNRYEALTLAYHVRQQSVLVAVPSR
jgi:hypothetical protein